MISRTRNDRSNIHDTFIYICILCVCVCMHVCHIYIYMNFRACGPRHVTRMDEFAAARPASHPAPLAAEFVAPGVIS